MKGLRLLGSNGLLLEVSNQINTLYIEFAFLASLTGIIIFLAYKSIVIKQQSEEKRDEHKRGKYDPIEHVFTGVSVIFDITLRFIQHASKFVVDIYKINKRKRQALLLEKHDESIQERGVASFYLKRIAEYKKKIRKKSEESLDNK